MVIYTAFYGTLQLSHCVASRCSVGAALTYHLSDVRGMSLWYDKFGVLGLNTETVQRAVSSGGAFMLKASELQQ